MRVITSLHGSLRVSKGGLISSGSVFRWSGWWKDIVNLGSEECERWFFSNIECKLGDGGGGGRDKLLGGDLGWK